jgi:VanZ family protein
LTRPAPSTYQLFIWYWLPALVYVVAIIVVSAQPRLKPPFEFHNSDRVWHVAEYLGLGIVLVRAIRATLRLHEPFKAAMVALAGGAAIAIGDELFQSTVPGRMSSHHDVLADVAGLVTAQLLYLWFTRE